MDKRARQYRRDMGIDVHSAITPLDMQALLDASRYQQETLTAAQSEGPRAYLRSLLEKTLGKVAPSDRAAAGMADKLTNVADFVNVPQQAFDVGKALGSGDKLSLAMSMIPGKADEAVASAAKKGIRAYHGTPHDFDRFSMDKIGTGEGAQAYGHGLYFAEHEGVAEGYRDALSRQVTFKGQPLNTHPMDSDAETAKHSIASKVANGENPRGVIINEAGEWRQAAQGYARYINDMSLPPETREAAARQVESFNRVAAEIEKFDPADFAKNPGHMYEVNINADPDAFLDWDKPLSEQPEAAQLAAFEKLESALDQGPVMNDLYDRFMSGEAKGEDLVKLFGKDTSEFSKRGIPGIKYLDAGSRGSDGGGTRNYVVFDDRIIDIVKKYGLAGAVATGFITQQEADEMKAQGYT